MKRPAVCLHDAGSTLIEVLVSVAVISVLAGSLTTFFIGGLRMTHHQGHQQTATQLALSGVELARTMREGVLLTGRSRCAAICADAVSTGAAPHLAGTERWDRGSADGVAATLPLPSAGEPVSIENIPYRRYFYVGRCWLAKAGGACGTGTAHPLLFYRVVVAVTWPDTRCSHRTCSFVTSTLFAGDVVDRVFRAS